MQPDPWLILLSRQKLQKELYSLFSLNYFLFQKKERRILASGIDCLHSDFFRNPIEKYSV